jgi:hypothetical protein
MAFLYPAWWPGALDKDKAPDSWVLTEYEISWRQTIRPKMQLPWQATIPAVHFVIDLELRTPANRNSAGR